MINYLIYHIAFSLAVLYMLYVLRSAPPRFRLWLAMAGILSWAVPFPLLRLPVELPAPVADLTIMVTAGGNALEAGMLRTVAPAISPDSPHSPIFTPTNLAILVFTIGGVFWLISLFRHTRQIARLQRESRMGDHLWAQIGMQPGPRLCIKRGAGALTTGILAPTIWVGEDHVNGEELRSVLYHERNHVRRGDNLWIFAIHACEMLFWWNPLVRLLAGKARYYIELSCDHDCGRAVGPEHYRRALARVVLATQGLGWNGTALTARWISKRRENMIRLHSIRNHYALRCREVVALAVFFLFGAGLAFMPQNLAAVSAAVNTPEPIPQNKAPMNNIARVGERGVEPPVFTKKVSPEYPERAKKIKLQGYVILEAILGKSGEVRDVKVLRGLGKGKFGFEQSAIDALQKWEYLPGKVAGRPADVRMTLKITFLLDGRMRTVPVLDWSARASLPENTRKPEIHAPNTMVSAVKQGMHLVVPVQALIDADGRLLDYQVSQDALDSLVEPQILNQNLARMIESFSWTAPKADGIPYETTVSFQIPVPLVEFNVDRYIEE